jgi:hypothetical protein
MGPAFDTSQVSPSDAAVTLRSLRRRFAEVFAAAEPAGAPADAIRRRPQDGGLSPVEHAAWTATAVEALHPALRRVALEHDPGLELPPVDVDPPVGGGTLDPQAELARLAAAAEAMATTIADIHGIDWDRSGHTADGPVRALDIARLAVRIAVEHLRAAEATVADVSGREVD